MPEISKNTTPISFDELVEREKKKVHQMKGYFSLYLTPKGDIIDCGYPDCLGHNNLSKTVYDNLDQLPEETFNSCLRGLGIPFEEVNYYLEDYYKLFDLQYSNYDLFTKVDKVLLGTEDRICQDLGFVKVAINSKLKTFQVVVPSPIFNKRVTGAQKDIIEKLSNHFLIDLDEKLKAEQKESVKLATQLESELKNISSKGM